MATTPSASRKTRADVDELYKYRPGIVRIPQEAHTLVGFQDWVFSDEVPEKRKLMFLKGEILLETSEGMLRIPPQVHTLAGFREWVAAADFPEKLKVMFLNGEVYLDMSEEEIRSHAAVKTTVCVTLEILNQEIDFGELYIDGALITNVAAKVSNNPDAVAVFWESVESGKVRYVVRQNREMGIEGSPDWVLEIVSPYSVKKDTRELRQAYHAARIREYWLIDARGEDIDFQILHWRKSGYTAAPNTKGWLSSRVFQRQFRLTRQRNRRGAWTYRLEIKPLRKK